MSIFLLLSSSCLMTRSQGQKLEIKINELESEVAKLQKVRHDMEILLSGKVALLDRITYLESSLSSMRESMYEGASENSKLVSELQYLRNQLEESKHLYEVLDKSKPTLANDENLSDLKKQITIPSLKEEHFSLAKKFYQNKEFTEAIYLFDTFIKQYEKDELSAQSYFFLGDIYSQIADTKADLNEKTILKKRAVVNWQKVVELNSSSTLCEESLYKIGLVLESLNNKEAALAAFKELLLQNKDSKRANLAKKHIAKLEE